MKNDVRYRCRQCGRIHPLEVNHTNPHDRWYHCNNLTNYSLVPKGAVFTVDEREADYRVESLACG